MTLTTEDLQAIKVLLQPLASEVQDMKSDMQSMQSDMQSMQSDMQSMQSDMQSMNEHITRVEDKLIETRLHLENHTDRNIQLLAENFIELINKLNAAIPAANKLLTYEVKVDYLYDEVNKLKKAFN